MLGIVAGKPRNDFGETPLSVPSACSGSAPEDQESVFEHRQHQVHLGRKRVVFCDLADNSRDTERPGNARRPLRCGAFPTPVALDVATIAGSERLRCMIDLAVDRKPLQTAHDPRAAAVRDFGRRGWHGSKQAIQDLTVLRHVALCTAAMRWRSMTAAGRWYARCLEAIVAATGGSGGHSLPCMHCALDAFAGTA